MEVWTSGPSADGRIRPWRPVGQRHQMDYRRGVAKRSKRTLEITETIWNMLLKSVSSSVEFHEIFINFKFWNNREWNEFR